MASFKKSASLKIVISFVDADGAALNISGATVKFMMKVRESDPDILAIVSKQTGGGGVSITNAAGGGWRRLRSPPLTWMLFRKVEFTVRAWPYRDRKLTVRKRFILL